MLNWQVACGDKSIETIATYTMIKRRFATKDLAYIIWHGDNKSSKNKVRGPNLNMLERNVGIMAMTTVTYI